MAISDITPPLLEPTFTYGAIVTIAIALIGFGATLLYNAYAVGRYAAGTDERLKDLSGRMRDIEISQHQMTNILVELAKSKIEIQLLSKRIDDVQQHGSHRLAEILQQWRDRNPGR